ncbi:MAG: ABC transporter ATP-binding protein [archaeon]
MSNKEGTIDFKINMQNYFSLAKPYALMFLVLGFFVLTISLASIGEKFIFKLLIDYGTLYSMGGMLSNQFVELVTSLALAFVLITIAKAISYWFRLHTINRLDAAIIVDLKKKFFTHIVRLSHKFHTSHKTGSLIARMTRGARAIETITDFFMFECLNLGLQLLVVSISILYFDPVLVIVLFGVVILFVLYILVVLFKQQKAKIDSNDAEDNEKAFIGDIFLNIDTVKYFGKENTIVNSFSTLANTTGTKFIKSWDFERWVPFGQSLIFGAGLIILISIPLFRFVQGEISIGTLAFVYMVFFNVTDPLTGFIWGLRRFYDATADFQSLFEYDKLKSEVVDKLDAKEIKIKKGKIEFKNVGFNYNRKQLIKNFDLSISPNEKIAFVGPSGAGKTTLVKLLFRLYDVESGEILIDGKNINKYKQESMRSELSIVPQECILFNDSIYNNVVFAKPAATKKEVFNALKAAQLYDFVESLPEKENTMVGERGIKLSGGEKQRLSIARALLANKKVLVLDEATSSLDSRTEHQIQVALKELMEGRTTIIIAHRLSTIMSADKIVVIEKGEIAQVGTHNELIKQKGTYKELWEMQKGGYIE